MPFPYNGVYWVDLVLSICDISSISLGGALNEYPSYPLSLSLNGLLCSNCNTFKLLLIALVIYNSILFLTFSLYFKKYVKILSILLGHLSGSLE